MSSTSGFGRLAIAAALLALSQHASAECPYLNKVSPAEQQAVSQALSSSTDIAGIAESKRPITLEEFRRKRRANVKSERRTGLDAKPLAESKETTASSPTPDLTCYAGGNWVMFETAKQELVVLEGTAIRDPVVWYELTSTYFPPGAESGGAGGTVTPPTTMPKKERCDQEYNVCYDIAGKAYANAIKSCDELKFSPLIDLLTASVRADCRDQSLNNYTKAEKGCRSAQDICLAKPGN
ncbi:hypothetical protein [Paucibacter soli]|uniref:hypothetical protein n=1 Tax=Paucibacter soli TaxID=3133433 RepID=UPI0030B3A15B